jgi:phage gpG-like protein
MNVKSKIPKSIFNLDKIIQQGIRRGLQNSSIEIAGSAGTTTGGLIKDEMNKPKTGKIYPIIVKKRRKYINHQASNKSGLESSAVLSGELAKSVRGKTLGTNRLEISADTPYAAIQEKGGVNSENSYVAPRNNLIRPITQSRGNIMNNIRQAINSQIK